LLSVGRRKRNAARNRSKQRARFRSDPGFARFAGHTQRGERASGSSVVCSLVRIIAAIFSIPPPPASAPASYGPGGRFASVNSPWDPHGPPASFGQAGAAVLSRPRPAKAGIRRQGKKRNRSSPMFARWVTFGMVKTAGCRPASLGRDFASGRLYPPDFRIVRPIFFTMGAARAIITITTNLPPPRPEQHTTSERGLVRPPISRCRTVFCPSPRAAAAPPFGSDAGVDAGRSWRTPSPPGISSFSVFCSVVVRGFRPFRIEVWSLGKPPARKRLFPATVSV